MNAILVYGSGVRKEYTRIARTCSRPVGLFSRQIRAARSVRTSRTQMCSSARIGRITMEAHGGGYGYAYPTFWGTYPADPSAEAGIGWPAGPAMAAFTSPASTVMLMDDGQWPGTPACNASTYAGIYSNCDSRSGYVYPYVYAPTTSAYSSPLPLHTRKCNIAWADGHVKVTSPESTMVLDGAGFNEWSQTQ